MKKQMKNNKKAEERLTEFFSILDFLCLSNYKIGEKAISFDYNFEEDEESQLRERMVELVDIKTLTIDIKDAN